MKKIFTFLLSTILFISCNKEGDTSDYSEGNSRYFIPKEKAENIVRNLINLNSDTDESLMLVTNSVVDNKNTPLLYMINAQDNGKTYYSIVSADKRTKEVVLALGENNLDVNDLPEQMTYWLEKYKDLINFFRKYKVEDLEKINDFEERVQNVETLGFLIDDKFLEMGIKGQYTFTYPFVETQWNQGCVYNTYSPLQHTTPSLSNCEKQLPCGKAYTGCVSTCLSQVVNYYKSMPNYNYSIMKDSYDPSDLDTPSGNEVGKLMKKVAEIMRMNYSCTGSGSYASYYLPKYSIAMALGFRYQLHKYYFNGTDSFLFDNIKDEISTHNIVVFSGQDKTAQAGHLWLADGGYFNDSITGGVSYIHFNWGWGGKADGWFAYGDFNSGKYNFNSATSVYFNFRK